MADETKILVQKRAKIKMQLTRFKTYLEKWSERPDEQQLIERLEKIKLAWDSFDEIQTSLELLKDDDASLEEERVQFEDSYFELVARAQRRLTSLRPPAAVDNIAVV